jgi:hypothetical protein
MLTNKSCQASSHQQQLPGPAAAGSGLQQMLSNQLQQKMRLLTAIATSSRCGNAAPARAGFLQG